MIRIRDVKDGTDAKWLTVIPGRHDAAPVEAVVLKNVLVLPDYKKEAAILSSGQVVSLDIGKHPILKGNFNAPATAQHVERAFYFSNAGTYNYYHTMLDGAGSLYHWLGSGLPVYLHERNRLGNPQCHFVCDLLDCLGAESQHITSPTVFGRLMIGMPLGLTRFERRVIPNPVIDRVYHEIRMAAKDITMHTQKRIYISRRPETVDRSRVGEDNIERRCLLNESAVVDVFAKYGFEEVAPEKYTLREQVKLFEQAEMVAGAWGAGFINTVFCRKGTTVISLGSPEFKLVLEKRANIYAGELFQGIKQHTLNDLSKPSGKGWTVDVKQLKQRLAKIIP